jgi:hypothetical protein
MTVIELVLSTVRCGALTITPGKVGGVSSI